MASCLRAVGHPYLDLRRGASTADKTTEQALSDLNTVAKVQTPITCRLVRDSHEGCSPHQTSTRYNS